MKEQDLRKLIKEMIIKEMFVYDTFYVGPVEVALHPDKESGRVHWGWNNRYNQFTVDGKEYKDQKEIEKIFEKAFKLFQKSIEKDLGGKIRQFK